MAECRVGDSRELLLLVGGGGAGHVLVAGVARRSMKVLGEAAGAVGEEVVRG